MVKPSKKIDKVKIEADKKKIIKKVEAKIASK